MTQDSEDAEDERAASDHRTLVNLLSAIAVLALAVAGFWLLNFLDEKRKIESCLEAGRRDCLRTYDPVAAPPK